MLLVQISTAQNTGRITLSFSIISLTHAHEQTPVHKANLKYITRVSIYMVGEGAIIS